MGETKDFVDWQGGFKDNSLNVRLTDGGDAFIRQRPGAIWSERRRQGDVTSGDVWLDPASVASLAEFLGGKAMREAIDEKNLKIAEQRAIIERERRRVESVTAEFSAYKAEAKKRRDAVRNFAQCAIRDLGTSTSALMRNSTMQDLRSIVGVVDAVKETPKPAQVVFHDAETCDVCRGYRR